MIPTLVHYKQIILDNILTKSDPNDRHIREWTHKDIQVKRLLRDMVRDQLIRIEYEHKGKTVKRHLKQLVRQIIDHPNY